MHCLVFVFVSLLICMGSFISNGLTSGLKEGANMTIARSCNDNERQVLLDFKANLVDINNNLNDWGNKEKDCCQWVGVTCNNQTGHVIELDLSSTSNGLSGNISPSLPLLSQLQRLDLSGIDFQLNPIPNSLSSLTNLLNLRISAAKLSGSIPHQLANLSNLVQLDLSSNSLSGSIPDSLGDMTSLVQLNLSKNLLHGSVPNNMGKLSSLYDLDLSSNSLNGSISDAHFLNLTKLTYLDLSINSFMVNFNSNPRFKLLSLKMRSCKLGPSFPMWIQTQGNLEYLDISNAGISDNIPRWFWDIQSELRFLNLSSNEIKGMLPNMKEVGCSQGIDLSYNQLEGMIPKLPSKLAALNLSGNKLSGTLSALCQIDEYFTFLDLSNNLLSGGVPTCLQRFKNSLVVLNLSNNSLSGEIPSSLGSLSQLQALYLRKNAFVGEIPMSLRKCTKLRFLDLGENKLSGNIPEWIGETLSELYVLVLWSNRLEGDIPPQICWLNNLQFLDLSNNELSGNIPKCFGNFTAMATRGFQDNIISHSYFSYISSFPMERNMTLVCLRASERSLPWTPNEEAIFIDNALVAWKGTRREFGRNLYLLKSIDISSNRLYGNFPDEITNLLDLQSLNLSNNKLHGQVPKRMDRLGYLEILDLSTNELSGNIPSSFSQMKSLNNLNLSYNNLSGRIPTGSQLQSLSSSSYIGNPQLCGFPLTQSCELPPPPDTVIVDGKEDVEEDGDELLKSYYTGMGTGFGIGFLGICGALFLNRRCRYFFFASLNNVKDWIYVTAAVHFQNLHRKFSQ